MVLISCTNSSNGLTQTKKVWWHLCAAIVSSTKTVFEVDAKRFWKHGLHQHRDVWTVSSRFFRQRLVTISASRMLARRNHQTKRRRLATKDHHAAANKIFVVYWFWIPLLFMTDVKRNCGYCVMIKINSCEREIEWTKSDSHFHFDCWMRLISNHLEVIKFEIVDWLNGTLDAQWRKSLWRAFNLKNIESNQWITMNKYKF